MLCQHIYPWMYVIPAADCYKAGMSRLGHLVGRVQPVLHELARQLDRVPLDLARRPSQRDQRDDMEVDQTGVGHLFDVARCPLWRRSSGRRARLDTCCPLVYLVGASMGMHKGVPSK